MLSVCHHHRPTKSHIQVPHSASSCAPIVGGSLLSDEVRATRSPPLEAGVMGSSTSVTSRLGEADGTASKVDWAAVEMSAAGYGVASSPASTRAHAGRATSARVKATVETCASTWRASVSVNTITVPRR